MSYFNSISGGGSSINFNDPYGGASGSVSAPGVTFGGGGTFPICAWQVHGMGNVIRFIDWDGSTAIDISVSGATVSGSIAPPCQSGPYGCFPPCVGHVSASGTSLHVDYASGDSGDISFGCP